MRLSEFLKLFLLGKNDYADNWDTPLNANFEKLDTVIQELEQELVTDPEDGVTGKLAGNFDSLQSRLNAFCNPVNGKVVFNNYDLYQAIYSRKQWETNTNSISHRMSLCEEDRYVDDLLKRSLIGSEIRRRLALDSGDSVRGRRYSGSGDVDLHNFYFRTQPISSLFSVLSPGVISCSSLGLMQIGGLLYSHQRPFTFEIATSGTHYYVLCATNNISPMGLNILCQQIRSSSSTGCSGASLQSGSSTIIADNIGTDDVENNHWKPVQGQIFRVFVDGKSYDYPIKSVSTNSIEIYGVVDIPNVSGASYDWAIVDPTQPVFKLEEIINPTYDSFVRALGKSYADLPVAFIYQNNLNVQFFGTFGTTRGRVFLWNPAFNSNGKLDGGLINFTIDSDIVPNIKSLHVVTVEKNGDNKFVVAIDPKRKTSDNLFANSFSIAVVKSTTTGEYLDSGTHEIRLVHPDYGDSSGAYSYWTTDIESFATGYELMFLGLIVELQ